MALTELQVDQAIAEGGLLEGKCCDEVLLGLYADGKISEEVAVNKAEDRRAMRLRIKDLEFRRSTPQSDFDGPAGASGPAGGSSPLSCAELGIGVARRRP